MKLTEEETAALNRFRRDRHNTGAITSRMAWEDKYKLAEAMLRLFPNGQAPPLVLEFGTGNMRIERFTGNSTTGLLLKSVDEAHQVVERGDLIARQEPFISGETVLSFSNVQSLDVFLGELVKCRMQLEDEKVGEP